MDKFLVADEYVDYQSPNITRKAYKLFKGIENDVEKVKKAYYFVRDEVSHTFDIESDVIAARASEVLLYNTGICHAKANLLAALLRSQHIPVGFCFQHLTLAEDESLGYCVHCYNAVYVENKWIKLDARGNTNGTDAQFSLDQPRLAFPNRKEYDEYFWTGIYATPHEETMQMLKDAKSIQDIITHIPDEITHKPDFLDV